MATDIPNQILDNIESIQNSFSKYASADKGILLIAGGVTIGLVTKELITSIMNDIILPILIYFNDHSILLIYFKTFLHNLNNSFVEIAVSKVLLLIWLISIWFIIIFLIYIIFSKLIKMDFVTERVNFIKKIKNEL